MTDRKPTVLFLCVHNAGRSQMAAALLARQAGGEVVVHSAGSAPGDTLNPAVVAAMAEVGIDLSSEQPKKLTSEMAEEADVVVTMGCGDACPVYPGKQYLDWELPDPAGRSLEEVRPIRDEIATRVQALAGQLLQKSSIPVTVRHLERDEWRTARAVRLRALEESPEAFASSLAEEVDRPDAWWIEGMTKLAWFVAEADGRIVGVVAGMPLGDRTEVISMWVEPAHRGTGAAQALLSDVVKWAKEQGDAGLCLALASDNGRARTFYERSGFVATGAGEALRSRPEICTTEMRLELRRTGD